MTDSCPVHSRLAVPQYCMSASMGTLRFYVLKVVRYVVKKLEGDMCRLGEAAFFILRHSFTSLVGEVAATSRSLHE